MTTIAKMNDGKWYVVKSQVIQGKEFATLAWAPISVGYDTSEMARAQQANIVFGRV